MTDGRRLSVDVPLSRTLVALKRVRSLRDPDTNPISKFATNVGNIKWEVDSCGGPCLDLVVCDKHHTSQQHRLKGGAEECGDNLQSDGSSRVRRVVEQKKTKPVLIASRDRTAYKSSGPTCVPHSKNFMEEEVDSCCGQSFELAEMADSTFIMEKSGYGVRRKPITEVEYGMVSRVGSPCISIGDAHMNSLSRSTLGLGVEAVDIVDSNFNGCGIGNCWPRTPKFRDHNLASDVEGQEHPLLSPEGRDLACADITSYPETPRSLSQKFRPKSFNDLVGLHVVAESLLNAISRRKVAQMYLFHGPRGTGKTSTARIFAAALNCLSLKENRPCGFCRECSVLFSGRSRDVKELDARKVNRRDRIKALLKSASLSPVSSSFRIFIIEECHDLHGETWDAILDSLEEVSRHAIFLMITSDPDKLPHSCTSHCQKYYFPKVKESDIVSRLRKICLEERSEFDKEALEFIAVKSNGSLQDAETMLDQLALLGKRITLSLAYELIGVVSDDELLDLLDLALSADTANTVRCVRELLRSRVDPMQLTSQLAELIMDILAGRHQSEFSEAGRKFFQRHALGEADLQKLKHALKILSETEKQLRTARNQATWLTVALLQFSSGESSLVDVTDSKGFQRDNGAISESSPLESMENSVCYVCNNKRSVCLERHCNRRKLETIWRRTAGNCQSSSLRRFLLREGSLSSLIVTEGLVVAEVEFYLPDHVSRAEKSWKLIMDSLKYALRCNLEIRIKFVSASIRRSTKLKKPSFHLLSCSGRKQEMSDSTMTDDELETSVRGETVEEVSLSYSEQSSTPFIQKLEPKRMHSSQCLEDKIVPITNVKDNVKSNGSLTSKSHVQGELPKGSPSESNFSSEEDGVGHNIRIQEPENQPSCYPKTAKFQRRFFSSDVARKICLRIQPHSKHGISVPEKDLFEAYVCTYDPYNSCPGSDARTAYNSGAETICDKSSKSNFFCWRTPKSPTKFQGF